MNYKGLKMIHLKDEVSLKSVLNAYLSILHPNPNQFFNIPSVDITAIYQLRQKLT